MDGLQVRLLGEFPLPKLCYIEIVDQLHQQFAVQVQDPADGAVAIQRNGDFAGGYLGAVT